jgi:catechol 2,3-dioxygenase-like lactoylglutathione lyase family enzyme
MLNKHDAVATIAVKNLDVARKFYEGVLGLTPQPEMEEGVMSLKSGSTTVLVYTSQYAGTNRATTATWNVDDLEGTVASLKSKGVTFEHYDMPGVTRKGDIHGSGNTRAAWFKDPDGNILALAEG